MVGQQVGIIQEDKMIVLMIRYSSDQMALSIRDPAEIRQLIKADTLSTPLLNKTQLTIKTLIVRHLITTITLFKLRMI